MKSILILLVFMIVTPNYLPAKSLEFEWANQISLDGGMVYTEDIINDSQENVYVCGYFWGTIIFGSSATLTETGTVASFLTKYDSDGNFQWVKQFNGDETGVCSSISIDENDMIYVCGSYFSDYYIGFEQSTGSGFISKYSPEGIEKWTNIISTEDNCVVYDIHSDKKGGLFITGSYIKDTDFGNGHILPAADSSNSFIAGYDYLGVCQWVKSIVGEDFSYGFKIRTDSQGNVFCSGYTRSDLDFGNNISTTYNGCFDSYNKFFCPELYFAKFNEYGICQWAKIIGDSTICNYHAFSIDESDNIYFAGGSNREIDFGNGIEIKTGHGFPYFAKFNNDGICLSAKVLAEATVRIMDFSYYQDELYFCGQFGYTLDIENGTKFEHKSYYPEGYILNSGTEGQLRWGKNLTDKVCNSRIRELSVFNHNSIYVTGHSHKDIMIDGKYDFKATNFQSFVAKLTPGAIINGDNEICENGEGMLTATAGFDKYLWSTGETTQSIAVTESGTFTVKATDEYNTEFNSESFYVRMIRSETAGLCDVSMTVEDITDIDQRSMKFENKGSDPISVESIELKDASEFLSVSTSVSLPTLLNPGDFIDIVLTYAPETNHPVSDSLIVIVDAPCPVRFANYIEGFTSVCHLSSFIYPDFSSKDKLNLVGSRTTDSSIVLTWAKQKEAGAMWRNLRVPVKNGFYCKFRFRLHDGNNYDSEDGSLPGADGIAFVIQNSDPKTLGGNGGRIGYAGIENALAVELDLFSNDENQIEDYFDPDGNHIAVQTGGSGIISSKHTEENNLGITSDVPTIRADGTIYSMMIEYNLDSEVMNIYLGENISSASPVLTITDLILDEILDLDKGEGAYVGITAATGAAAQTHEILDWEFCPSNSEYVGVDDDIKFEDKSILQISPNPTGGYFTIKLQPKKVDCRVNIYDLLGHKLLAEDIIIPIGQSVAQLDVRGFSAGAYLLRVNIGDEIVVENLMIK